MQVWAGIDNHSPRARLQPGAHALTMPCGRSCSVYACPTLLGSYRRRVPCSKRPRLLVHWVPNFINFYTKSSSDMLRSCEALYPSSTSHPMSWQSRLLGHKIGRVSEQISSKTGGCTKPWYSSPKDIHHNQESVILVVLGVTNQYSFDRPATSIEIRWFLQIPPWPLVIPVTCKIKGVSTEFRWNTFWWKWYQPIHLHFPNLFMKIKAILFPPLKTRLSTDPVRCRLCHQHSQCVCNAAICGNAFSIWSSNHQALSHANHRHCRWTWTNMTPGPPKDAETVDSDFPTSAGTDSRNRIKTCRGESSAPPGYWIPGVGKVTKIKECFS
jgi:hypothetical protein